MYSGLVYGQSFNNHSEVRVVNGNPVLFINDGQVPPFAYMSYLGEAANYREMASSGLEVFCLLAYLGDQGINSTSGIKPFRPSFWKGMNEYDFSIIKSEFDDLINVKKDAKVIIRVHLDAPVWWERQNPSELCRLPTGESHRVSYSSKKWRKDAGVALLALLDWIRCSDYNSNLIGIHVAGGFTEEWFFHYKDKFFDESQSRSNGFREWLKEKYEQDNHLLQKAWNDSTLSFRNAKEADISGISSGKSIRKKGENSQLDDTFEYHGQIMSDNIAYFSRLVKEASKGRLLTGAFYGYHLFVNDPRRGHGSLSTLLDCPDIDYLSSPNDYRREVGVDWLPMAAIRSVQLHGKLWLAENDTRTSLTTLLREKAPNIVPEEGDWYDKGVWIGPRDLSTSKELLWKNAGRMLAYGYGGWWFDMWGGWFSDPELRSVFQKTNDLYKKYVINAKPDEDLYHPEIAVVVDEKLQFYDDSYGRITGKLFKNRYALGQVGTSFDIYLREDLAALEKEAYKVIWYIGIEEITGEEEQIILRLNAKSNRVIVTSEEGSLVYNRKKLINSNKGRVVWTPEQIREVLRSAGVHIFSTSNDVIYAGKGWLMVHLSEAGRREILLPSEWSLTNVKENGSTAYNSDRLMLEGEYGETFLFKTD
ncbi:hypothetical protein [Arcticibacterium luteifluviistationis]|uniref:Glycoside hydrolase family 42 N-terminal domain-containing protein n=1 Tax=Arcticibacterium luteifluviistationis TaxID=1784714 RepID=A0A2Z4GBG0_9BACT|nr:hypothetical protein [Arcticibacterium luteifluviistationis]AWV98474.1 hypothetical protein DJ013_09940 [Arcticibacterium luteifluviistationis]